MNEITCRFEALNTSGLLPSPKGVALAVMEISARPDADIRDIVRLIQADPAMAGRILRYANAAQSGAQRQIASLAQAVTLLGLFRVRQIALGFSLIDHYRQGGCVGFDYEAYWTCALATGIAAQRLSALAQCPPDESFTCGLLSGVGRLALATAFPQRYSVILQAGLTGRDLTHEERSQFGIDHAELTAEMLTSWGLPGIFTNAVRHHEDLTDASFIPGSRAYALSNVLHFAMQVGQLLNHDESHRWQLVPTIFNAAAQTGMAEEDVTPLIEDVVANWQGWARDLHLPTRAHIDMRTLLAAPPPTSNGADGTEVITRTMLPSQVAVLIADVARRQQLVRQLEALGIQATTIDQSRLQPKARLEDLPDVVIIDLGNATPETHPGVQAVRQADGFHHLIALIPDAAEARAASILAAGMADYLLYSHSETAMLARLANAERLVTLQVAVRAERELAVSSSGEWYRTNRRLLHEALTDPLTQIPNRRSGLDRFAQEWSIVSSNGLPMACLMMDIDHFKRVNDTYGHDVGDIVLQQVASMIQRSCRRDDIIFRYGGEEFCTICPTTASTEALRLAERILQSIREARFGPEAAPFPLTISIGVAIRLPAMKEFSELIVSADKALYAAKQSGRDRAVAAVG